MGVVRTGMLVSVLFFSAFGATVPLTPPDTGCIRWRDSLVVAGMRSLDTRNFTDAGRYFAGAFRCGVRKDSMHYYIAELYLRQMVLDTALVFNMAVEQAGTFPRELWTVQRAKIYWLIGRKKQADSLLTTLQEKERHDLSLSFSGRRSVLALNKFTYVLHPTLYSLSNDTDDMGGQSVFYRYTRLSKNMKLPWFLQMHVNSYHPVPTRYFADEFTDTLFRSCGLSAGFGTLGKTPELTVGSRGRFHPEGKADIYRYAHLSLPFAKQYLGIVRYDQKWVDDSILDESKIDLSGIRFSSWEKTNSYLHLTLSYRFARSDFLQRRQDVFGVYRPLPTGYISMDDRAIADSTQPGMVVFKDPEYREEFSGFRGREWNKQPMMYLLTAPEHDVNATLKYNLTYAFPFAIKLDCVSSVQAVYYIEKLSWYTDDNNTFAKIPLYRLFRDCAIVYNRANEKWYLYTDILDATYYADKMYELSLRHHEKRRLDTYFVVSSTVRREWATLGELFITGTFTKGFSTLSKHDPMVTLNYGWELSAGWIKDVSIKK